MPQTLQKKLEEQMTQLLTDSRLKGITVSYEIVRGKRGKAELRLTAIQGELQREIIIPFDSPAEVEITSIQAGIIESFWHTLPYLILWVIEFGALVGLAKFLYADTPQEAQIARDNEEQFLRFHEISCNKITIA